MVEEHLRYVLTFVDGHVRFGEAKNGAMLVAAGGAAVSAASLVLGEEGLSTWLAAYLIAAWATSLVAVVIALLSFLPRMQLPWLGQLESPDETDNLLFFGHIQKYDAEAYWNATVGKRHDAPIPRAEFNLSEQIVINARIASRKFTLFKYSAWVLLAAFLTPLGALFVYWITRDPNA